MARKYPDGTIGYERNDARALNAEIAAAVADGSMPAMAHEELRAQMLGALTEESERVVV